MREASEFLLTLLLFLGFILFALRYFWLASKIGEMDSELRMLTKNSYRSSDGKVRLDYFCIETGVHAAIARWYLNRKAHQLNGWRHVDEWGDTVYYFGESKQKLFQHLLSGEEREK